ncbi:hypothetical protein [Solitalea lacus]|uniref:hypothetical protein n=1 Tax=Solitalea lacus TaxID=2911172 RepID=UPI001ED9C76F|nr:hypothetical protein [Solitalea lacus]UKJ07548.1 hypothetical protein L2B55_18775 [Solitalea lacus]
MKNSTKILCTAALLLVFTTPLRIYWLEAEKQKHPEKSETKDIGSKLQNRPVRVLCVKNLIGTKQWGVYLKLWIGKNNLSQGLPMNIADSMSFAYKQDTLYVEQKITGQNRYGNRGIYHLDLSFEKMPEEIFADNVESVEVNDSFFRKKMTVKAKELKSLNLSVPGVDSLIVTANDSTDMIVHIGNATYAKLDIGAGSSINLANSKITTLKANLAPDVKIGGTVENIKKMLGQ